MTTIRVMAVDDHTIVGDGLKAILTNVPDIELYRINGVLYIGEKRLSDEGIDFCNPLIAQSSRLIDPRTAATCYC